MKRAGRLLEILTLLHTQKSFTVKELAHTFSVSVRTMLRDLHVLSESGVPLQASPGPGGGYKLISPHRMTPVSFTTEEAVALVISYESLTHYTDSPFEKETLSVIAKLFAILPPEALQRVTALRQKIRMRNPRRLTNHAFLRPLLHAALEQHCVEITYDSLQRQTKRVVQPAYLYAFDGYWYCRCYCFLRKRNVSLRVDRIHSLSIKAGHPLHSPTQADDDDELASLPLLIGLTSKGCKLADGHHQLSQLIERQPDGSGVIESKIRSTDIEWISRFALGLGEEATVEQPVQVIEHLRDTLTKLSSRYAEVPG